MNIVIIGAGEVGQYLASVLSKEEHNVIIVDKDVKILQEFAAQIDVATRVGSGTEWQLLDDLLELLPDLLIALTDNDEINIVSCSIAKHLGYPMTIARVTDNRFLNRTRLDFAKIFDIDYFICPELLVANNILKFFLSQGALQVEHFMHGALELRTFSVPKTWKKANESLSQLKLSKKLIVSLIKRQIIDPESENKKIDKVIFPHGHDVIMPEDEVTIIGETDEMQNVPDFFGIQTKKNMESAVIVGGSLTALHLAKLLERRKIAVRIIEKDALICTKLAEQLPNCTILHHDGADKAFLVSEKVDQSDIFVVCTHHDPENILCAMLAKDVGCQNIVCVLNNPTYKPYLDNMGINHAVSPRIVATSRILSQILSGTVNSLISLYDDQAEIIEINVSNDSRVAGIPLTELGPLFPHDFLIAMIQNRGRIMVAHGERVISPGDTVIVVTSPSHIPELEKIF